MLRLTASAASAADRDASASAAMTRNKRLNINLFHIFIFIHLRHIAGRVLICFGQWRWWPRWQWWLWSWTLRRTFISVIWYIKRKAYNTSLHFNQTNFIPAFVPRPYLDLYVTIITVYLSIQVKLCLPLPLYA